MPMKNVVSLFVLLFALVAVSACGGATQAEPKTIVLTITDPPGPAITEEVPLGAEVTLRITTPADDRAHVHGYEIEKDIPAGQPTDVVFTANMSGSYEVESHVSDAVWLNLVVK